MKTLRVLVACEYSGIVREAFKAKGHDVLSCDLLPTEIPGYHWQGDIFECLEFHHYNFDLMIAFPPCTDLAVSGAKHFWYKRENGTQQKSIEFFMKLVNTDIDKIVIENPIGIMLTIYRKPDQIIQPWQFGHGETKATCLWLKNLPKLIPTNIVEGREQKCWKQPPGPDRWKIRSKTFQGIADALADQYTNI